MEQLIGGRSDDNVGRILKPDHSLVAGSIEDVIAILLAHDAGTPLRDIRCIVTPVCPPARAYVITDADLPDLEGQELELRSEKPHLFKPPRLWSPPTRDGEL